MELAIQLLSTERSNQVSVCLSSFIVEGFVSNEPVIFRCLTYMKIYSVAFVDINKD